MTNKIKNIYIAGCGGMLGEAFYEIFSKKYNLKCTDKNPIDDWLSYLDFSNFQNYLKDVSDFKTDYLFHLGAMTDLELCEKHPEQTYINNTESVKNAVEISKKFNIPLLFISTAGIFDGKKDFYEDDDIPNPLCHYAKSKYKSEIIIENNITNFLICRAGWMMGGGKRKDKKFVNKIINQIKGGSQILNIVNDKNGTPTYTHDFAKNVLLLIEKNIFGKFNLVCEGLTDRFEVAKEILKFYRLDNKIKINKVNSNFFNNEYFVKRPNSERLINKKLNEMSMNIMRDWKICLNEYLNDNYKNFLNENN